MLHKIFHITQCILFPNEKKCTSILKYISKSHTTPIPVCGLLPQLTGLDDIWLLHHFWLQNFDQMMTGQCKGIILHVLEDKWATTLLAGSDYAIYASKTCTTYHWNQHSTHGCRHHQEMLKGILSMYSEFSPKVKWGCILNPSNTLGLRTIFVKDLLR